MPDSVVLDIDGTLVDTNYYHVIAWDRAFRAYDVAVPLFAVHRAIGMGGDRLVTHVAGDKVEARFGGQIRDAWEHAFDKLIDEIRPVAGARELLAELDARKLRVVLASSGKRSHVETYVDLLDAQDLVAAWTTSDDVEDSKPAPDLIGVALDRVGGGTAVSIGDSVWDCQAGRQAGVAVVAVLTGGFSRAELLEAGADRVFDSLIELRGELDDLGLRDRRQASIKASG